MKVFAIVITMITALNVILYLIPIQVRFIYDRNKKKDHFELRIKTLWGLVKINIKEPDIVLKNKFINPVIKIKTKLGQPGSDEKVDQKGKIEYKFRIVELLEIYRRMRELMVKYDYIFRRLMGQVKVYNFYWVTGYGFENPAYTGMAYGVIWGVKGIIFNYLQGKVKKVVGRPQFYVNPDFRQQFFSTRISCIFAVRLGHIITTGLKILVQRIFKRG